MRSRVKPGMRVEVGPSTGSGTDHDRLRNRPGEHPAWGPLCDMPSLSLTDCLLMRQDLMM